MPACDRDLRSRRVQGELLSRRRRVSCHKAHNQSGSAQKSGGSLESFISDLEEPAEELERRFKIDLEDFKPYGDNVIADLKALAEKRDGWQAEKINYEGIRINTDKSNGDGWFLLRMSVHDPILVLNLESISEGGTAKMLSDVTEFLKAYDKLN